MSSETKSRIATVVQQHEQDGRAQRLLIRANYVFCLLSIFDINVRSIPFDDVARFIAQWVCSEEKPTIDSIESTHSCFHLDRCPGVEARLPVLHKPIKIARMNRSCPTPSLRLLCSHTGVV